MKGLSRISFLVIISLMLLLRIGHVITYNALGNDKIRQVQAAYNLQQGRGYVESSVVSLRNPTVIDQKLALWPIGYSCLLTLVDVFFHDLYKTQLFLDVLFTLVLFLSLYGIYALLTEQRKRFLFVLFLGISYAPFHYLSSTDLIAAALFAAAMFLYLYGISRNTSSIGRGLLIVLLIAVTPLMRYAYAPFLLVLPIMAAWMVWRTKNYRLLLLAGCSALAGFLLMAKTNSFPSGQINSNAYWVEDGQSIHWNNLRFFDAFLVKSVLYADPIAQKLEQGRINSFKHPASIPLQVCLILGSLVLFALIIRKTFQEVSKKQTDPVREQFFLLVLLLIGLNTVFLAYLSLSWPAQIFGTTDLWTFVCETRYFAPALVFVPPALFFLAMQQNLLNRFLQGCVFLAALYLVFKGNEIYLQENVAGTAYETSCPLSDSVRRLKGFALNNKDKRILLYRESEKDPLYRLSGIELLDSIDVPIDSLDYFLSKGIILVSNRKFAPSKNLRIEQIDQQFTAYQSLK